MPSSALKQVEPELEQPQNPYASSWLDKCKQKLRIGERQFNYKTSVHPCQINGERVLVYERGLKHKYPDALNALKRYAKAHGFALKEDQRTHHRPVGSDRRARLVPMLALSMTMGGMSAVMAEDLATTELTSENTGPIEEITVIGVRQSTSREYLIEAGKRFIAGPFGEVEAIVTIADQVKSAGEHKRISTRGMVVPDPGVNAIVDRYDFTFPASCGGGKFSYYEGDGFSALGYHGGKRVILDVLVGGGPFTAPKLWGPYDQILNDNTQMHLMSGNGEDDGMGMLKASYSIGMVADMSNYKMERGGEVYQKAISATAACETVDPGSVALQLNDTGRSNSEG